ncbi:MAG: hypothetical protein K8S23_02315 [Candidatus Cloacimonetes bacterium]|nr:hypothetical protein [Candidatus Cloacimonadota bacterium]
MKKLFLITLSLVFTFSVYAFTPTIDGVKDGGWGSTPDEATFSTKQPIEFNLEDGCYVTDDSNNIYFGLETDNDPWGDGKPIHFHIAIDIRNTSSGGTNDAWGSQITYGQTYLPDYDIISQWSTDDQSMGWTGFQTWNGSGWDQVELTNIAGGGNSFSEFAVSRTWLDNIAQGNEINISVWQRPSHEKNNATSCIPLDDTFPEDWGDGAGKTCTTQFSYVVQTAIADNIDPQVVSADQINQNEFDITYNEPMDNISASNPLYYTVSATRVSIISVTQQSASVYRVLTDGFTGGTNYTVDVTSDVKDLNNNGVDPANNNASFLASDYYDVTFQVNMQYQTVSGDGVFLAGSFNGWNPTATPMNAPARENIYSVTLQLESTYYEYKFINGGDWESIENRSVTTPEEDYEIPVVFFNDFVGGTSQEVTVSFQVNMYTQIPVTSTHIAGDFTDWGSTEMIDLTSDNVYFVNIVFPAGSDFYHEFKFIKNGTDWEDGIPNRQFTIDDDNSTQVLPIYFWENIMPVPTNLSVEINQDNILIMWDEIIGATGYNIYRGTTPDNISEIPLNSALFATNFYLDVLAAQAGKYFYKVRAVQE